MPIFPRTPSPPIVHYLAIKVTPDFWNLLKQIGKVRGQSLTQVIRDAILDEYDLHHVMMYPQTKVTQSHDWLGKTRSPQFGPTIQKHISLPISLLNELYKLSDERLETVASLIRGACIRQYDLGEDLVRLAEEKGYKARSER